MVPYEPATLEVGMTEADLSNKNLGAGGAIIVGAWISHKDNGAVEKLLIGANNSSGAEAGKALGSFFSTIYAGSTLALKSPVDYRVPLGGSKRRRAGSSQRQRGSGPKGARHRGRTGACGQAGNGHLGCPLWYVVVGSWLTTAQYSDKHKQS